MQWKFSLVEIFAKCVIIDVWSGPNCASAKTLHKKWSFPWRISSVNVAESAGNCGFGHIYWRNPWWKTSIFVQWDKSIVHNSNQIFLDKPLPDVSKL